MFNITEKETERVALSSPAEMHVLFHLFGKQWTVQRFSLFLALSRWRFGSPE